MIKHIQYCLNAQGVHHDAIALSKNPDFMSQLDEYWQDFFKRMAVRAQININNANKALDDSKSSV